MYVQAKEILKTIVINCFICCVICHLVYFDEHEYPKSHPLAFYWERPGMITCFFVWLAVLPFVYYFLSPRLTQLKYPQWARLCVAQCVSVYSLFFMTTIPYWFVERYVLPPIKITIEAPALGIPGVQRQVIYIGPRIGVSWGTVNAVTYINTYKEPLFYRIENKFYANDDEVTIEEL